MKKKNGFTLVEILAAIVILSIIIAILVPVIGNIIDRVKLATLRNNAKALLEAGNIYYAKNMEEIEEPVEFKIFNGVQTGYDKLEFTGKVNTAYLMLLPDNRKAICVDNEKYSATKSVDEEDITIEEGICTGEWDDVTKSYLVSQESGGSFAELSIKSLPNKSALPNSGNTNDIIVITNTKISGYYVSAYAPSNPSNGMVWVVETPRSVYYLEAGNIRIGVSYAMQYEDGTWNLKEAYVYNDNEWKLLYYVDLTDSGINLENSNLGDIELEKTYEYKGEYEEYRALFPGYYTVELWGAQGTTCSSLAGGLGAYTKGDIYLSAGDTLYVYVGGSGSGVTGGWNGGGTGYNGSSHCGGGGGGATDVRVISGGWNDGESLKSRIMVAAGGGGATYYNGSHYGNGGTAGGLEGGQTTNRTGNSASYYGVGGTQTMGGYYYVSPSQNVGGFGYGGSSALHGDGTGAGGGGWYGGGGGGNSIGPGGGGSSYISGHEGSNSLIAGNGIVHSGSAFSHTGYYFINTRMIDGTGYGWTTAKENFVSNMPTHDGTSTMVGNTGAGYAKIKFKAIQVTDPDVIKAGIEASNEYKYTTAGTTLYSGGYQEFIAPVSGLYQVDLYGAQGGTCSSLAGGLGAHTKGEIYLESGTKIYIYVGATTTTPAGGYNGGGNGYDGNAHCGHGGGGATDIRLIGGDWDDEASLKSRIMVAAGGGGATYYSGSHYGNGGVGGAFEGGITTNRTGNSASYYGTGGAQSMPGYYVVSKTQYLSGFGYGSASNTHGDGTGGGGGGWYGGAGGGNSIGPGGGGSSYISGHEGCSSIDVAASSLPDNIIHTGSAFHDSGYFFTNTRMDEGINSGNGYAVIKLIGSSRPEKDNTINFTYTYSGTDYFNGRIQEFIVPVNGTYQVDLYGAQGGTCSSLTGGPGAHTTGRIYLTQGTKLYLNIGGTTFTPTGGWNGGGSGYDGNSHCGHGGGGATDIRTISGTWDDFDSLKSRIMVAAGGGGATYYSGSHYGNGGVGGAFEGGITTNRTGNSASYYGTGGTQSMPGYYVQNGGLYNGYFGKGSASNTHGDGTGGGGSGYYGGAGGGNSIGPGGGGSSYISGHTGCSSIDIEGSTTANDILHTGSPYHESGYFFTNTAMEAGVNNGMGHAQIKLVSNDNQTSKNNSLPYSYWYSGSTLYNGRYQTFTAPETGNYAIELWGAQGGTCSSLTGGPGGYTYGETYIEKGTKLYVYVGGTNIAPTGGWNGGGNGYDGSGHCGHGGGGATDIRISATPSYVLWNEVNSLRSRIMVAAGGGGATYYNGSHYGNGGIGGGLEGGQTTTRTGNSASYFGTGANQIIGGHYQQNASQYVGIFGSGADSNKHGDGTGAGGGGWYGGGAGGNSIGPGGGGSSYISGHAGCIGINADGTAKTDTYSTLDDSKSFNGYYFRNTRIIDGAGYGWTTSKDASISNMPTHDGSGFMTGNTGNGYAKITYLGN